MQELLGGDEIYHYHSKVAKDSLRVKNVPTTLIITIFLSIQLPTIQCRAENILSNNHS